MASCPANDAWCKAFLCLHEHHMMLHDMLYTLTSAPGHLDTPVLSVVTVLPWKYLPHKPHSTIMWNAISYNVSVKINLITHQTYATHTSHCVTMSDTE